MNGVLKQVRPTRMTYDYNLFVVIKESNRLLRPNRVKELEESFLEADNGHLLPLICRTVTPDTKYGVLDGQHRLKARMNLGLPIYYIVDDEITIEQIRSMNEHQYKWNFEDAVDSRISEGNGEYVLLKQFKEANRINYEAAFKITTKNPSKPLFKAGRYQFDNAEHAKQVMVIVNKLSEFGYVNSHFCRCVSGIDMVMNCLRFDVDTFLSKLENHLKKGMTFGGTSYTQFAEAFVDIYNYHTPKQKQIGLNVLK